MEAEEDFDDGDVVDEGDDDGDGDDSDEKGDGDGDDRDDEGDGETESNNQSLDNSDLLIDIYDDDSYAQSSDEELLESASKPRHEQELIENITCVLNKIRNISRLCRNQRVITSFVLKEIEQTKVNGGQNFISDFFVRWNSTFNMIDRFVNLREIAYKITTDPESIDGVTGKQIQTLENNQLSDNDWDIVFILHKVLNPFYEATKMLSGRKYSTLSLSYVIKKLLFEFLNTKDSKDLANELLLKKILLKELTHHLNTKISDEQKNLVLVI